MKHRYALVVLFALLFASSLCSFHSYRATENWVSRDMNQALALTLAEQQSDVISQDTIRVFNSHLQAEGLRGKATLAVDTRQSEFTCYARCSAVTILSLSDQRFASSLWMAALLWGMFCLYLRRKVRLTSVLLRKEGEIAYGGLTFSDADGQFLSSSGEVVRLTPMQQQLLEMFFRAPSHQISKTEICETLWPKKPDAYDTLYTLIRRLRPIIEKHSSLRIESDRSKSYCLKDNELG